jgi:hypothetical protein
MGTIYRVTVVAETTDDKGGHEGSETLFELAGGADMVARIAPSALADALSAEAPETLGDQVMDSAAAAGAPVEQKPRRPRRTKAQIAADEAAARNPASVPPLPNGQYLPTDPATMQQAVGSPAGMSVPPVNTATPVTGDYNPFGA